MNATDIILYNCAQSILLDVELIPGDPKEIYINNNTYLIAS